MMQCKFCSGSTEAMLVKDMTYYACANCDSIFAEPLISWYEYIELYGPHYHFEHQIAVGHLVITDRIEHDYKIAGSRLEKVRGLGFTSGSLLDIGCSNGAFVKKALELGYNAYGIEIHEDIVRIANEVIGSERIIQSSIEDFGLVPFDIVVMNDVIEHVCYPLQVLAKVCKIARQLLVIEAPDPSSKECKEQGVKWKHLRYKEHFNLLSSKVLVSEAEENGMSLLRRDTPIPMKMSLYLGKIKSNYKSGDDGCNL